MLVGASRKDSRTERSEEIKIIVKIVYKIDLLFEQRRLVYAQNIDDVLGDRLTLLP